jgi:hypothetical protein
VNKRNIIISLTFVSLVVDTIASGQGTQAAADVPQARPQLRYAVIDLGEDAAGKWDNRLRPNYRLQECRRSGQACRLLAQQPESINGSRDVTGFRRKQRDWH